MFTTSDFQKQYQYLLLSMYYIEMYKKNYTSISKIETLIRCEALLHDASDLDDNEFVSRCFEVLCLIHMARKKESLTKFFKTGGNLQAFITTDWIPTGVELSKGEFNRQSVISCLKDSLICLAYPNLNEVLNSSQSTRSREKLLEKSTYSNEIRLALMECLGYMAPFLLNRQYVEKYIYEPKT